MGNAGRVLMIPKGDYNAATTYERLDFVYYQGRSYVCKQTSTGNAPTNTTYWQALTGDASAEIQALTNYVADMGVKNVYDMIALKKLSGRANNGITYTVNDNGTVSVAAGTVSGTESVFPFGDGSVGIDSTTITNATHVKPNKTYVASFGINLGEPYYIQVFYKATSTSSWTRLVEGGSGTEVEFTVPSSFYDIWIRLNIYGNGTAVPAMTLYPMIREAGVDADGSYQPYAKTNVELTQDVAKSNNNTSNQIASAKYGHVNVVTMSGASISDGDNISAYVASVPISNNVPWSVMFDGTSHTNVTVYLQIDGVVRLIDSTGHTPSSSMTLYGQLTYIN